MSYLNSPQILTGFYKMTRITFQII